MALVQSRHCPLKLLQPCDEILLGLPLTGQEGLHHPSQREMVPYICTLRDTSVFLRHICKRDLAGTACLISRCMLMFFDRLILIDLNENH